MKTPRRMHLFVAGIIVCLAGLLVPARAAAQAEIVEYYGTDAIGSVRIVFTAAGAVADRIDYGPFGELLAPSTVGLKSFAGLFRDGEAGLDYAEARMYQPRIGRFNAPDPVYGGLFAPQRWNRYSYASNNPTGFVDPQGLAELEVTPQFTMETTVTAGLIHADTMNTWLAQRWNQSSGTAGSGSTGGRGGTSGTNSPSQSPSQGTPDEENKATDPCGGDGGGGDLTDLIPVYGPATRAKSVGSQNVGTLS